MVFVEAGVGLVCVCSGISLMLHSLGKKMGRTPYCEWRTIRRLERRGEEESFFHGQEDDESPEESGDFRSRFSSSEYVRRLAPEFAVMVEKEQRKQKM
mmetsp:Transcript_9831/g.22451  ORF Transcript_9831/g.22451 Transcript_9831/m.22451 type:complete len:98 (-) Transcript_9831:3390-3683(-)